MAEKSNYFVLRAKAVPEVLLKVVEAKRLLDSGKLESVQEATDAVGISRCESKYSYHTPKCTGKWHCVTHVICGCISRVG